MEIDQVARGLLLVYVVLLGLCAVFFFSGVTTFNGNLQLSALALYISFVDVTIITLGSVDFSRATIRWETPAVAALIFAIATLLLEKSLTIFALVVVIASMLILTSNSLPFPASRIAKAIGAAVAGVIILYIVTLVCGAPVDPLLLPNLPLLLPNLLLYGATVALAAGYIAELRFPRVYYYISLAVIAVVGAFAIVTGGVLLQKLNQLTASDTFADAVFIFMVSIYLSATLLTALGVLAIIYLVRVLLAKMMQPSEQQPKSPGEIELHPYEPDVTEAR
jgi:hypothetical protein